LDAEVFVVVESMRSWNAAVERVYGRKAGTETTRVSDAVFARQKAGAIVADVKCRSEGRVKE
jgi:hypothetical protein